MREYTHPSTLVETGWIADHLQDAKVVVAEIDVDTFSYDEGHIPGAVGWDWARELCDTHHRDILSKEDFEQLMSRSGITPESTVVLYGDNNNWFAAWAFWQMKMYGHNDVRLMNGGRRKWLAEGRELTLDRPSRAETRYKAKIADRSLRALQRDVLDGIEKGTIDLVDVRSSAEYKGEILAPPGLPETCQRGGHIPGAANVPWGHVCNDDGTFKSAADLEALYRDKGITGRRPVVAYCRIGERSSHTWFVLKYLLGFDGVTNYDGSWTEWGNLVGAPIEKP